MLLFAVDMNWELPSLSAGQVPFCVSLEAACSAFQLQALLPKGLSDQYIPSKIHDIVSVSISSVGFLI